MLIAYFLTPTCIISPLLVLIFLFIYQWRHRRTTKLLKSFYSMSTLPLIGHVHHLLHIGVKSRISKAMELSKDWHFPATVRIFHIPLVVLATPDNMKTVFSTTNDQGLLNKCNHMFGNGILLARGEQWRNSRRIISSAFSPSMMQNYLKIFNQYSVKLYEKLRQHADTDKAFDIWEYVANLNVDMIFETMSGHKINSLKNNDYEYFGAIDGLSDEESRRYTQPLLYLDWMYDIYFYVTGTWKFFEIITKKPIQIIEEKMIQFNQPPDDENSAAENKRETLLDTLVKAHLVDPNYPKNVMQDDLVDIIVAGSATTSITASFTLLMLAVHQDVQDKVYQEIKEIFSNNSASNEMNDILKLVYLDQCIKETLRKFPPIPITFRKHTEDIVLNDKQTIPANCDMVISLINLHNNPQIYENPDDWNPNNFDPEATSKRDKYAYLPFGAGPRTCIGAKYAMISLKIQLAHLLRSYRFTTDIKMEDIQLGMNVAMKKENGYRMKLWHRESYKSSYKK